MTNLFLLLFLFFLQAPDLPTEASLLESGKGTTRRTPSTKPKEIKVVSYNIRWRSGDDLKVLIKLLQEDPEI